MNAQPLGLEPARNARQTPSCTFVAAVSSGHTGYALKTEGNHGGALFVQDAALTDTSVRSLRCTTNAWQSLCGAMVSEQVPIPTGECTEHT